MIKKKKKAILTLLTCFTPSIGVTHTFVSCFHTQTQTIHIVGPTKVHALDQVVYKANTSSKISPSDITWGIVGDNDVAQIGTSGLFIAQQPGCVQVVAMLNSNPNIRQKMNVIVEPEIPQSITINAPEQMCWGTQTKLSVDVEPKSASTDVIWSVQPSDAPAEIAEDGTLTTKTGIKPEFIQVVATAKDKPDIKGYATIYLNGHVPSNIEIIGPQTLKQGEYLTYKIQTTPAISDNNVKWESSDKSTLSISETTGEAQALKVGSVTITATYKNDLTTLTVQLQITIEQPVDWTICEQPVIGQAFSIQPATSKSFTDANDAHITFKSTTYKDDDDNEIDVHKPLKKKDLILTYDASRDNLLNKPGVTLSNNELTIPRDYLRRPSNYVGNKTTQLNLYYLGSEISDAITWDTIKQIADVDQDKKEPLKYFQVGDYKLVTKEEVNYDYFRIIDFFHDKIRASTNSGSTNTEAPFTFESVKCHKAPSKWILRQDDKTYNIYYSSDKCYLSQQINKLTFDDIDNKIQIVDKPIVVWHGGERSIVSSQYKYWILSCPERNVKIGSADDQDGTVYPFYDPEQYCHTFLQKWVWEKEPTPSTYDWDDPPYYYTRTIDGFGDGVFYCFIWDKNYNQSGHVAWTYWTGHDYEGDLACAAARQTTIAFCI